MHLTGFSLLLACTANLIVGFASAQAEPTMSPGGHFSIDPPEHTEWIDNGPYDGIALASGGLLYVATVNLTYGTSFDDYVRNARALAEVREGKDFKDRTFEHALYPARGFVYRGKKGDNAIVKALIDGPRLRAAVITMAAPAGKDLNMKSTEAVIASYRFNLDIDPTQRFMAIQAKKMGVDFKAERAMGEAATQTARQSDGVPAPGGGRFFFVPETHKIWYAKDGGTALVVSATFCVEPETLPECVSKRGSEREKAALAAIATVSEARRLAAQTASETYAQDWRPFAQGAPEISPHVFAERLKLIEVLVLDDGRHAVSFTDSDTFGPFEVIVDFEHGTPTDRYVTPRAL